MSYDDPDYDLDRRIRAEKDGKWDENDPEYKQMLLTLNQRIMDLITLQMRNKIAENEARQRIIDIAFPAYIRFGNEELRMMANQAKREILDQGGKVRE